VVAAFVAYARAAVDARAHAPGLLRDAAVAR